MFGSNHEITTDSYKAWPWKKPTFLQIVELVFSTVRRGFSPIPQPPHVS